MTFRWLALLTLWTLLSGPIFGTPTPSGADAEVAAVSEDSQFVPADNTVSP